MDSIITKNEKTSDEREKICQELKQPFKKQLCMRKSPTILFVSLVSTTRPRDTIHQLWNCSLAEKNTGVNYAFSPINNRPAILFSLRLTSVGIVVRCSLYIYSIKICPLWRYSHKYFSPFIYFILRYQHQFTLISCKKNSKNRKRTINQLSTHVRRT